MDPARPAGHAGARGRRGLAGRPLDVRQHDPADDDDVAVGQVGLLDPLAVDPGAVGAAVVDDPRAAALSLAGCARQAAGAMERLREAIVPLDLYLASDRGRYPSYRRGELIELIVQTNHDAFVYCVLRDSRGSYVWQQVEAGRFRRLKVITGPETDQTVVITAGLAADARVVVSGAYLLESEYALYQGTDPMAGMDPNMTM